MHPRSFYKLLFVSVLSLAAAVTVWVLTPDYSSGTFFGDPLIPGLIEKINEVEAISIEHHGRTMTFLRAPNGDWTLMEEHGYPADKERIRNMLIGLAHLEKIEPKTALPEFYPDLQVEDNTLEKSNSYLVSLLNAEGQPLTSLLVGKNISGITWNGQGYFVRFSNDALSWLVRGNIDVTGDKLSWLPSRILPLVEGRTASVTLLDGTKTREIVYKRSDSAMPLQPFFMSDSYFLFSADFLEKMEKSLTSFTFENAIPRPSGLENEIPFTSAMIETVDGLNIYMFLYLMDSKPYAAVSFAPADKASEDVQKEAIELESLHNRWLYQMPSNKVSALLPFLTAPEKKSPPSKKADEKKTAPAKKANTASKKTTAAPKAKEKTAKQSK